MLKDECLIAAGQEEETCEKQNFVDAEIETVEDQGVFVDHRQVYGLALVMGSLGIAVHFDCVETAHVHSRLESLSNNEPTQEKNIGIYFTYHLGKTTQYDLCLKIR